MTHEKALTLSIVIPAFNEERYIKACLDSIAAQTVMPDEVIVVNNNSTDKTVEIAKSYSFVTLLHEKRQHQVFAQATGFNAASSDILGRIDADSILPSDWVFKIKNSFEDKNVAAVTGGANPYDAPLRWLGIAIVHTYVFIVGLIAGHQMIWGANCAVSKKAWNRVKGKVLMRPDIWEDYDLSFCLKDVGNIKFVSKNRVGVSFRSLHTTFAKYISYQFRSVRTFYLRKNFLRLGLFCILWITTPMMYPISALDDWLLEHREL